jgi:hypothetical protein
MLLLAASSFSTSWAGPITVDPANRRWLFKDGEAYFWCGPGDPENFFHRGTLNANGTRNGDQSQIISKLATTDANSLWMAAVRSHGGDGGPTENPFVNHDPNQGVNNAVLDQWNGWIDALDNAGIMTFFVFYDDGSLVWNTGSVVSTAEANFIRAVVDRLENHDHLVWCVAEEYEEALSSRATALAQKIAEYDDRNHPIALHQRPGTTFHFPDDPYLDSFAFQTGPGVSPQTLHDRVVDAWNQADGRYNVIMAEVVDHYSDRTMSRKLCWAAAMGGGTVMVESMDVINTQIEALHDCGRLATFFQSLPFQVMVPSDALKRSQTEYVLGNLATGYVLYSSNLTGSMGMHVPQGAGGTYNLHWLDCASGLTTTQSNVNLIPGDRTWPKPPGFGMEVALSLARGGQSTAAPPSTPSSSWGRIKNDYR